jgi:hypothetical protein
MGETMAMPAQAKYPMIESNTPAATWFGCEETRVR